jgi:hypothetical protein
MASRDPYDKKANTEQIDPRLLYMPKFEHTRNMVIYNETQLLKNKRYGIHEAIERLNR